jgi:N-acetylneuraminic acid mutarotase
MILLRRKAIYSVFLILVLLLCIVSISLAQDYPWTQKQAFNTARYNTTACALGDKIYLFGGTIGPGGSAPATSEVEVYDSVIDTWTHITNMPEAITHPSSCTINGKIYIFGGAHREDLYPLSTVYEYNPVNNTFDTLAPMPTARMNTASCAVGEKIYVLGGQDSTGNASDAVEEYDPLGDIWVPMTEMPSARAHLCAGVVNDTIYAIGGALTPYQSTSEVDAYDPATDTWTLVSSMQEARTSLTAATLNGKIYVIGGSYSPGSAGLATIEEYDPKKDKWIYKTDMPTERVALTSATCNGFIYALGGAYGPWPFDPLSTNEEYNSHYDLLALVEFGNVSKSYAIPGADSVVITAKIKNPTGISLLAEIEAPDQVPVDNLQLFDDGNHNDGDAGDSLFANLWPVLPVDERNYYVDLEITRIDTDTVVNHMNNLDFFTTIGPVIYDTLALTEPIPGIMYEIKLGLGNNGSTATAKNITAFISTSDTNVNTIDINPQSFGDIEAGQSVLSNSSFVVWLNHPTSQIDFQVDIMSDGYHFWSDSFSIVITGISETERNFPMEYSLKQNYPNPFNPTTTIKYDLPNTSEVVLRIYNTLGQEVATLTNETQTAGEKSIVWDGRDKFGKQVSSGVYIYRLEAGDYVKSRKMVLLK